MTNLSGQEESPLVGGDSTTSDTPADTAAAETPAPEPTPSTDAGEENTDGDTPDGEKPLWDLATHGMMPENPEQYTIIDSNNPEQTQQQ